MKIKLLTPWFGPLPDWLPQFQAQMNGFELVDWQLFQPELRNLLYDAEQVTGVPCLKATPYAAVCDTRPLWGRMFDYDDAEWWGWCDLDVCFGDLDRLLGPLLADHDVISCEQHVSGPLTILRNCPAVNDLWRSGPYEEVLAEPEYMNWDEDGFGNPRNPSFTQLVTNNGLRFHGDDRTWVEGRDTLPNGAPSRGCELRDGKLLEVPTGRELLAYHFSLSPKRWPMPNRYRGHRDQQLERLKNPPPPEPQPTESPAFWTERLREVARDDLPIHHAVLSARPEDWDAFQAGTANVLRAHLKDGDKMLDAGCGYGALLECLELASLDVIYDGVDYCWDMIRLAAGVNYDDRESFAVGDLRQMDYPDDTFDWAVCRGLEGTVKSLVSFADWQRMRAEMLRVARRLLLIDNGCNWRVVERG